MKVQGRRLLAIGITELCDLMNFELAGHWIGQALNKERPVSLIKSSREDLHQYRPISN